MTETGEKAVGGTTTLGFSCGGCKTRWTGLSRAHCSACHRTFGGTNLFDAHRVNGSCKDPARMRYTSKSERAGELMLFLVDGIWQTSPNKRQAPKKVEK